MENWLNRGEDVVSVPVLVGYVVFREEHLPEKL